MKKVDAEQRRLTGAATSRRHYAVDPHAPASWEAGHDLRRTPLPPGRKTWGCTLYGGAFSLDRLYCTLVDAFGDDGRDADERTPRSDSALFAVAVSPGGRLLLTC